MIINNYVFLKIGSKSYKFYKDLGYEINTNGPTKVLVEHLTKSSSAIVDIMCSRCKKVNSKKYYQYKNIVNQSNDGLYYCRACGYENAKLTNILKYDSICPLTNDEVRLKSKKTMLKNYGVENISQLDSIRQERSESMKKNTDEYNRIILNKYGCNVSKLNWVKSKKVETTFKNWGVENPMQSIDIFDKSQKNGKRIKLHECGLTYRGKYEKHFLDYCSGNNIEVQRGPTIKYKHNQKNRYYHSDFFIPKFNLICEVKSSYYLNKYLDINMSKKHYSEIYHNFEFIIDKDYTKLSLIIKSIR